MASQDMTVPFQLDRHYPANNSIEIILTKAHLFRCAFFLLIKVLAKVMQFFSEAALMSVPLYFLLVARLLFRVFACTNVFR
jgi:hypothetical protein